MPLLPLVTTGIQVTLAFVPANYRGYKEGKVQRNAYKYQLVIACKSKFAVEVLVKELESPPETREDIWGKVAELGVGVVRFVDGDGMNVEPEIMLSDVDGIATDGVGGW
ncbi:hypothetical protein BC829DRAFT_418799 [Chytridium lagenaria]|nr:hypothetical protein BC829DRAFT_418799 [Chytridium lagenaria]